MELDVNPKGPQEMKEGSGLDTNSLALTQEPYLRLLNPGPSRVPQPSQHCPASTLLRVPLLYSHRLKSSSESGKSSQGIFWDCKDDLRSDERGREEK